MQLASVWVRYSCEWKPFSAFGHATCQCNPTLGSSWRCTVSMVLLWLQRPFTLCALMAVRPFTLAKCHVSHLG